MATYGTDNGATCRACDGTVWEYKANIGDRIIAATCWSCRAKRWFPRATAAGPVTNETTAADLSAGQRYAAAEGCHYTECPWSVRS